MRPRSLQPRDYASSRIIDKQAMPVVIETQMGRIEASVHVMINHRPSDVLNDPGAFVPLTDVKMVPPGGGAPETHSFIALNKDAILYLRER